MEKENRITLEDESENKTEDINPSSEKVKINVNSDNNLSETKEELKSYQKVENFSETNTLKDIDNNDDSVVIESIASIEESNMNNKFFFTEVMSTAGPRKNFQEDAREGDYDLGEDVVGCFVRKNKAFFWLFDGTSDNPIFRTLDNKEIISSRLLSQDIAWNLQRIIWDNKTIINTEVVLRDCLSSILVDWQSKLNGLNDIDKERLFEILVEKTSMTVSSTAIFGIFDLNGNLNVSQIGDSFIVTNPVISYPNLKGRFFVVIKANLDEKLFLVESNTFEDTRCNTISVENIKTIITGTDGISKNTQKWLQLKPADFTDPVFRRTISAIKHDTCDDKALCVIQILEDV